MPLKIEVKWDNPIELTNVPKHRSRIVDFASPKTGEQIPNEPGVYFFARRHGGKYIPLYIGSSKHSLRKRIDQQFKSVPLMKHIKTAKAGTKVLVTGIVKSRNLVKAIPIIENALIKKSALSGNDELSNIQGAKLKMHEIQLNGNRSAKNLFGSSIRVEEKAKKPKKK